MKPGLRPVDKGSSGAKGDKCAKGDEGDEVDEGDIGRMVACTGLIR
jgi:hypothetical protein